MTFLIRILCATCLALIASSMVAAKPANPAIRGFERGIKGIDLIPSGKLEIEELSVSARILGGLADVTVDLTIKSDNLVDYEADLALALPADAVVTGYALNVGKNLISGQLIEQPKARNLYEDEVRAAIDPGLAEVSMDNQFKTRVYPISKGKPRRFRLTFSAPFDPKVGLSFPLSREEAVKKVSLSVALSGYSTPPIVQFLGQELALSRDASSWYGNLIESGAVLRDLSIAGGSLATGLTVTRHARGERFFVISDGAEIKPKAGSGRLRVYWDRSLSHSRDDVELEVEVLERLVQETSPTAIDLVTFASDRPTVSTYSSVVGLSEALSAIDYRGATSLAGLDGLALPQASQCIMVSDGQVTIDRDSDFAPDCAVSILTSSTVGDGTRLGRLAQSTGGQFVRVLDGRVADSVVALAQRAPVIASIRDSSGRRIIFRSLPAEPGRWKLVGPMPEHREVRLLLSDGSERIYSEADEVLPFDAPGALWASQQVHALSDEPNLSEAMTSFARRYSVAGPEMSFLVLERPDQYLSAELVPPEGFDARWMSDYRAQQKVHNVQALNRRRERFDFVMNAWQRRKAWWNTRFVARPKTRRPRNAGVPTSPGPPLPPPSLAQAAMAGSGDAPDVAEASVGNGTASSETKSQQGEYAQQLQRASDNKQITVNLADLTSKRPYIAALTEASPAERMKVLRAQEQVYGEMPAFYLDTSEWFRLQGEVASANLLLLSSLELALTDDETRQIVAFRLERDKSFDRAIELFARLAASNDDFRPQPARNLALALAARGKHRGAAGRADLEHAFNSLVSAALNPASSDFDGFEVIALMEANALIPSIEALGGTWQLDPRLTGVIDVDVRIVMEWTADDADIDLWVDEPTGERVYYGNQLSDAGGQISNDMTDGYGPEEYAIRRAGAGEYGIRVNGYDADRLNPNGPGHVLLRLIRNFARAGETAILIDLDLSFQQGRNRDTEVGAKPVATLSVAGSNTN
jgi:hypothetical protein